MTEKKRAAKIFYNEELGKELCWLLASGIRTEQWIKGVDFLDEETGEVRHFKGPSRMTIARWRRNYPDFAQAWEKALQESSESLIEEALSVAFDESKDFYEDIRSLGRGEVMTVKVPNPTAVRRSDLKIKALMTAAKLRNPKRYGQLVSSEDFTEQVAKGLLLKGITLGQMTGRPDEDFG